MDRSSPLMRPVPLWVTVAVAGGGVLLAGIAFAVGLAVGGFALAPTPQVPQVAAVSIDDPQPPPPLQEVEVAPATRPPTRTARPAAKSTKPTAKKDDWPDEVAVRLVHDDYHKNPAAADAKYKGKKVFVAGRIEDMGQRGGMNYLAFHRNLGRMDIVPGRAGGYIGRESEPLVYCFFADPKDPGLLSVARGKQCSVEGIAVGRVDDGIHRNLDGYEFHVRVERCRVYSVTGK